MNTPEVDSSDSAMSADSEKPELYLIAHLVRGEPAFDIAQRLQIGDEEGWIIPTSGHRAYPYWWEEFKDVVGIEIWHDLDHPAKFPPADWPDHYTTTAVPHTAPRSGLSILADLGLGQSSTPIRRL